MTEHEHRPARWAYDVRMGLFSQRCAGCGARLATATEGQVRANPGNYAPSIRQVLGL